jgi:hypothetical protein
LTLNKYMAMGPSGAQCQEWPCWLVSGIKLLLCSAQRIHLLDEKGTMKHSERWNSSNSRGQPDTTSNER